MKQETLEEAVQKVANSDDFINGALFGSLWQQERMYSEEEVIKFGKYITEFDNLHNEKEFVIKQLFETFKNK